MQTWDEGRLTEDDVIESVDGTGYETPSQFVHGEDGYEPDPDGWYDSDDPSDDLDDGFDDDDGA